MSFLLGIDRTFYFSILFYTAVVCVLLLFVAIVAWTALCIFVVSTLIDQIGAQWNTSTQQAFSEYTTTKNKTKYFTQPNNNENGDSKKKSATTTTFNDDNFSSYSIVSRSLPFIRAFIL